VPLPDILERTLQVIAPSVTLLNPPIHNAGKKFWGKSVRLRADLGSTTVEEATMPRSPNLDR
jgi:hypothetical protein